MRRSSLAGLGALAIAAVLLTACASSGPNTPATTEPTEEAITPDPDLGAAWLDGGRLVGLVTLGSSTCIPQAEAAELVDGVLEVTLVEPAEDEACTADLVPRVTLVDVPDDVDPAQVLPISVSRENYFGEVDLPGVAGLTGEGETDNLPSAGWSTVQGQFIVLTWGSSTCVPVISDVAATGPAQVTVNYDDVPENQVCTMDMVSRAQVTAVNGLTGVADVQAVLTGGEFDNVAIPIYGVSA